jgi:hypothetical protein
MFSLPVDGGPPPGLQPLFRLMVATSNSGRVGVCAIPEKANAARVIKLMKRAREVMPEI